MNNHIISKDKTLLEALSQINDLAPEPLVLFVVDEEQRMVGTLTDGDSRRALIAGASVNDAQISEKHCGFLINRGTATAEDVWKLMEKVRRAVWDQFGVVLEPEVRLLGTFPEPEQLR